MARQNPGMLRRVEICSPLRALGMLKRDMESEGPES